MKKTLLLLGLVFVLGCTQAQQVADIDYQPTIHNPAYPKGKGPTVFIDEGHYNFHTKNGRYKPFASLLERDGYQVKRYQGAFKKEQLEKGKILVIANALHPKNVTNWFVPVLSAFSDAELEILREWIAEGGRLFLIADHMPMAGAAKALAGVFGFEFTDGFAMDTTQRSPILFSLKDSSLIQSSITLGRNKREQVTKVATFTGQAFQVPEDAQPILVFTSDQYVNVMPDTAWRFSATTPQHSAKGWYQGAYKKHGKGRIVAFGEAAMFTAQLAGSQKRKTGMNHSMAEENFQLLLNIIHWLDGRLD